MVEWMVVHEGPTDERMVKQLVDSLICEGRGLETPAEIGARRRWAPSMTWTAVKHLRSRAHGRYPDGGKSDEYKRASKVLGHAAATTDAAGIILVCDSDEAEADPNDRRAHFDAARAENEKVAVCIAVAIPKTEAWIIVGFDPQDDDEAAVLESVRSEIGIDPRLKSHQLYAGRERDQHGHLRPREAKNVLARLTGANPHRQAACLAPDRLPTLRARGVHNGLKAFLDEVTERLLPQLPQHP
jgi:hypothetical protein